MVHPIRTPSKKSHRQAVLWCPFRLGGLGQGGKDTKPTYDPSPIARIGWNTRRPCGAVVNAFNQSASPATMTVIPLNNQSSALVVEDTFASHRVSLTQHFHLLVSIWRVVHQQRIMTSLVGYSNLHKRTPMHKTVGSWTLTASHTKHSTHGQLQWNWRLPPPFTPTHTLGMKPHVQMAQQ